MTRREAFAATLARGLTRTGLALGGIVLGVGLSTNPAAVTRAETPKEATVKKGEPAPPAATKGDDKPPHIPVGKWTVEFANGVIEVCEINKDGRASVVEPKRTSAGKATLNDGSFKIVFEDNRVERWTPVGKRLVVEHWFPGNREPAPTPVLGVAVRIGEPDSGGLTDQEKMDRSEAWAAMSKMEVGSGLTDDNARKLIDPGYLKEHKLTKGAFPMARFKRGNLYANDLCDDYQTGIMIADTDQGAKELFVFRLKYYKTGLVYPLVRAYILPQAPPDPTTKAFEPWIYRRKL